MVSLSTQSQPGGSRDLMAAGPQGLTSFEVLVRRSPQDGLGLRIGANANSVVVTRLRAGPVQTWNQLHPDKTVRAGDHILSVNDVSTSLGPAKVFEELMKPGLLRITFRRACGSAFNMRMDEPQLAVFRVHLVRQPHQELGARFVRSDVSLEIVSIYEGLINDWNEDQDENYEITPGDHIVAVNGVGFDPVDMEAQLHRPGALSIAISRMRTPTFCPRKFVNQLMAIATVEKHGESTCAICLENFIPGTELLELPCRHYLHRTCGKLWFGYRKLCCPICQSVVRIQTEVQIEAPTKRRQDDDEVRLDSTPIISVDDASSEEIFSV